MATANPPANPDLGRWQTRALLIGVLGAVLPVAAAVTDPGAFYRAYLVAFNYWLGASLGCLALLMLQYQTGGAWGRALRPALEAASHALWPLALFFVPLAFGLPYLYEWAEGPNPPGPPSLRGKGGDQVKNVAKIPEPSNSPSPPSPLRGGGPGGWGSDDPRALYLNPPFFQGRAAAYFLIWLTFSSVLLAWSAAAGNDPERRQARRFRLLSGPGLALYGVAATFASVDWVMSLEAGWYSTIFPLIFVSHHVLTGMAVALVATIALALHGRAEERLDSELLRDLGNLLLAFVMIWAYLAFSQYLLIWSENLPEEIPWYLRRLRGGWEWAALALVLFQFAAPFLLLLFREVKEDPRRLLTAAVAILALQFVSWLWLIEPSFESGPAWGGLLDVSAWAGLGGLWSWWFLGQLPRRMGGPAA